MKKLAGLLLLAVVFGFGMLLSMGSANAQATRTWVSGVGDDANPCSRTAPCKTFAGAISKTATNGEINCLDPGGFGAVTITKSITIDCHEVFASILNSGTSGVIINYNSFAAGRKTVRLRNLIINGADTGLNGIRILGGDPGSVGSAVFIEDCLIDGDFGGTARGISDERTGGGELTVSNTTIRNMGSNAIALVAAATRIDATFENVLVYNSNFGLAVGGPHRAMIDGSVFSGNSQAGIFVNTGADVNVNDSVVSSNGTGVQNGGTIRFSNTDIAFNGTGISGATQSFGNNRISGNTSDGTAPTLIGPNNTNPSGQK